MLDNDTNIIQTEPVECPIKCNCEPHGDWQITRITGREKMQYGALRCRRCGVNIPYEFSTPTSIAILNAVERLSFLRNDLHKLKTKAVEHDLPCSIYAICERAIESIGWTLANFQTSSDIKPKEER